MEQPPVLNTPVETGPATPFATPKDSNLAIASLITGILGWTLVPILGAVAAIITGHLAKKEIRESPGRLTGNSMATAGLILGYIQIGFTLLATVVIIILMLIAANNWI